MDRSMDPRASANAQSSQHLSDRSHLGKSPAPSGQLHRNFSDDCTLHPTPITACIDLEGALDYQSPLKKKPEKKHHLSTSSKGIHAYTNKEKGKKKDAVFVEPLAVESLIRASPAAAELRLCPTRHHYRKRDKEILRPIGSLACEPHSISRMSELE